MVFVCMWNIMCGGSDDDDDGTKAPAWEANQPNNAHQKYWYTPQ